MNSEISSALTDAVNICNSLFNVDLIYVDEIFKDPIVSIPHGVKLPCICDPNEQIYKKTDFESVEILPIDDDVEPQGNRNIIFPYYKRGINLIFSMRVGDDIKIIRLSRRYKADMNPKESISIFSTYRLDKKNNKKYEFSGVTKIHLTPVKRLKPSRCKFDAKVHTWFYVDDINIANVSRSGEVFDVFDRTVFVDYKKSKEDYQFIDPSFKQESVKTVLNALWEDGMLLSDQLYKTMSITKTPEKDINTVNNIEL